MSIRVGSAAVAWAMQIVRRGTGGYSGLCLRFVRNCHNIPARDASARVAWSRIPVSQRHGGKEPPAGVPVFWSIGANGHVAESAGGGWCISTDILRRGKADRVRIDLISSKWGAQYLGWTESLNGYRVYNPPPKKNTHHSRPQVSASHVLAASKTDPHLGSKDRPAHPKGVRVVERALAAEGLLDDRYIDGRWTSKTSKAWAKWQRRHGDTSPSGRPGRKGLKALGRKHGFDVVA